MSTALIVISDGRGYLSESIPSLIGYARPEWFNAAVIVDDSGDEWNDHATRAAHELNEWLGFGVALKRHNNRQGGAAAISTAWSWLGRTRAKYAFHVEEDFTFAERIPLPEMRTALDANPLLANVVLRRQPVGLEGPGGYVGDDSAAHTLHVSRGVSYLVHDRGFWLNPCLYRADITADGWPEHGHEHDFTAQVRAKGYRFGVFGTHDDEPRCTHIGDRRSIAWTW